jgi:ferredoxin
MTYAVTDQCIRCKYQDCVDVCPVDAFREGRNMLVIDPEACIDCGVCEAECPAGAILPDSLVEPRWVALNAKYAPAWPVIRSRGRPFADADAWSGVSGKFEAHFSEEPGAGG